MKRYLLALAAVVLTLLFTGCTSEPGDKLTQRQDTPVVTLRREKTEETEALVTPAQEQMVTISTSCGDIRGIQQDGYLEFRGVRYAVAERWEKAELVTGWDGVYDATSWGDRCCQYTGFYGTQMSRTQQFYANEAIFEWPAGYSEDCLNLNIWVPEAAENCPVLVYIHGGAFMNGSNTDTSTDGAVYAQNGIIMISINYRLGAFATAYGDGYTGNLALTDQIAALHWIRDNIKDYGGDGSHIVIMGESAGAVSVQNLLYSPLVEEGLISGAIMMSGGGYLSGNPTTATSAEYAWRSIKEYMGVESLAELKDVSASELYRGWLQFAGSQSGASNLVLNGESLTDNLLTALRKNTVQNVPCIIGVLSEDCSPYTLYQSAVSYASKRAEVDGEPVYLYYFDRVQPGDTTFGAFHAADLYYVFGTLYRNVRPFDDIDYRIAEDMISYFCNFVKTGDPNGTGLAVWEAATEETQEFLHFGDEEPAMVEPDVERLQNNAKTKTAFPYAASIDPAPGSQETDDKKAISPEDLLGSWEITGWDIPATGGRKDLDYEAVFEFTESQRNYYIGGVLNNTRDYVWKDEYTIVITIEGADYTCGIYWGDDGGMRLEDPRYGIVYTCYCRNRQDADQDGDKGQNDRRG